MSAQDIQTFSAIAQVVLAVVGIVGATAVSLFVYYGSRRIATAQYLRSVYDAWIAIDTFLLSNPDCLETYNRLARPQDTHATAELTKRRHIAFLVLNPLSTLFEGIQEGYVERDAMTRLQAVLGRVLADDDVYRQTQEELFGDKFVALCREVKAKTTATR